MSNHKSIDEIILEFSKRFSFIDEDKFLELKDKALELCSINVAIQDFDLYFRRYFVKELLSYSKNLFDSDDIEVRKNVINSFINSNYFLSVIPHENLNKIKNFGSFLSNMGISLSQKDISIILNNDVFVSILRNVIRCYSTIINDKGIEAILDGDSFQNSRIILVEYLKLMKKDENENNNKNKKKEKEDRGKNGRKKNMSKKAISNLRMYFKGKGFSDEQIDKMYSMLPNGYRDIINSRFGVDWDDFTIIPWDNRKQGAYFTNVMLPNMIKMLENPLYIPTIRGSKEENKKNTEKKKSKKDNKIIIEEKINKKNITTDSDIFNFFDDGMYEDDKWDYQMIELPNFNEFLRQRSIFEIVVTLLRYGGVNGRKYSVEEISNFLGKKNITETIYNVIDEYRSHILEKLVEIEYEISEQDVTKNDADYLGKRNNTFISYEEYLKSEPLKWLAVAGLNIGYVTGEVIECNSIADFLELSPQNVISIVRNSLVGYKKYSAGIINSTIDSFNIESIDIDGNINFQKKKGTISDN